MVMFLESVEGERERESINLDILHALLEVCAESLVQSLGIRIARLQHLSASGACDASLRLTALRVTRATRHKGVYRLK